MHLMWMNGLYVMYIWCFIMDDWYIPLRCMMFLYGASIWWMYVSWFMMFLMIYDMYWWFLWMQDGYASNDMMMQDLVRRKYMMMDRNFIFFSTSEFLFLFLEPSQFGRICFDVSNRYNTLGYWWLRWLCIYCMDFDFVGLEYSYTY